MLPHNSGRIGRFSRTIRIPPCGRMSAEFETPDYDDLQIQKVLDMASKKRGRQPQVIPSEVFGRAENYRQIFRRQGVWEALYPLLSKAQSGADVERAFTEINALGIYVGDQHHFIPYLVDLIAQVIHDPDFPKKRPDRQIAFFADSLAARGGVSPRRSRDICEKERGRRQRAHYIVRREFYVECSCGYTGPALNDGCRKCAAPIVLDTFGQLLPNFRA
jgi:hypothetical protein